MTISGNITSSEPLSHDIQHYVGYVSSPNLRGTVTLVISCLLTLLLCVWSALHLNVPYQRASKLSKLWTNVKWIAIGIYAPELVVFAAWRQWSSANLLGKRVASLQDKPPAAKQSSVQSEKSAEETSEPKTITRHLKRRHPWTVTHDFFASTGGFAFELDDEPVDDRGASVVPFLPAECPNRLTLTARGIELLALCGHLPDISEGEIWDKSKANNLAKALVVLQALWMLLQVLGRLVAHLPVTLLEINTVAHVLCAFLMYAMWWHKPLLAEEPIIIRGEWVDALCAYMLMCSEQSGKIDRKVMQGQTVVKKVFAYFEVYSKTPEINQTCLARSIPDNDDHQEQAKPELQETDGEAMPRQKSFEHQYDFTMKLSSKRSLDDMRKHHLARKTTETAFFERRPRLGSKDRTKSLGDPRTLRRRELAAQAIATYAPLRTPERIQYEHDLHDPDNSQRPPRGHCLHPKPVEYVTVHVSNWPYDDLLRNVGGLTVGMILWTCNFIYGGIHATAWNEHFPSDAEKWFWRASCIYISFCGGFWIILNFVAAKVTKINSFWENWMDGQKSWIYSVLLGGCVFTCGFSFCASRVYLVVEAFLSIRSLVPAAYDTPNWSQMVPHF